MNIFFETFPIRIFPLCGPPKFNERWRKPWPLSVRMPDRVVWLDPLTDWPEHYFCGQSAWRNFNASKSGPVRVIAQGLFCSSCKLSPKNITSPENIASSELAAPGALRMRDVHAYSEFNLNKLNVNSKELNPLPTFLTTQNDQYNSADFVPHRRSIEVPIKLFNTSLIISSSANGV